MRISSRLLPIALFFVFYALIQVSFTSLKNSHERQDIEETKVFQEIVIDRFQRYLETPYLMTVLGAQFLSQDMNAGYEGYAALVNKSNPELLSFSVLNEKGVIVRAFPESRNSKSLGKVTQNYSFLLESLKNNETFFLSSPFRLYQGKHGFAFYMPIQHKKVLKGWYAVVISSDTFIKKFSLENFIELFNFTVIDEETGIDYFATSIEPQGIKIFEKKAELYGRKVVFRTWRKDNSFIYKFPWYFSVIMALLLAAAAAFIQRLYEQRKKVSGQLDNISILLRVTSKEALNNLIEIHRELNELNVPEVDKMNRLGRDINYLTNLVEQIDLLQTMAHSREGFTNTEHNFNDLLVNQINNFAELLERKNIEVKFDEAELRTIKLKANMWLFENSVLSNVFSHLLIYVESDSTIQVKGTHRKEQNTVVFRAKRAQSMSTKTVTRRIEVAKKVLQLHGGDLREDVTMDEIILTILCNEP